MAGGIVWLALAFEAGLVGLAVVLGWWTGYRPFALVRVAWEALAWGVVATAPLILGLWWCTRTRQPALARLMEEVEGRLVPLFARSSYFELAMISLVAGIGEEGLFRGVIQRALAAHLYPSIGLLAASVLFGLGHTITPAYGLVAGLIGLYLGALFVASGNLLPPIVAHALYDFVALVYLIRRYRARQAPSLEQRLREEKVA